MRLTGGGGSRPAGRVLRRAGMMQHGGKRARTHELDAAAAGEDGGFGHCMAPQQYPMGMQAMEHMVGMPPSMSASRGVGRMPMPHGSMADPYGSAPHFGGVRMMPAPPRREDMGLSSGFLSRNEQIETLIKMVLNAIIVQSEDEVFVPYGVAKKDGAAKVASSAVKDEEHGGEPGPGADGGGDDGGRDDDGEVAAEVHGAQGAPSVHDGAHAMGDGCGDRVHGCAGAEGYGGEGGEAGVGSELAHNLLDGGAEMLPGEEVGAGGELEKEEAESKAEIPLGTDLIPIDTCGPPGKEEEEERKEKEGAGASEDLTPNLMGILRACVKTAGEHNDISLKKHVNKILKAAPFHCSTGPLYYYTPDTPRNELERAERTPMVRGWAYRDPLTEEGVLREGLRRIPAMYRVHEDDQAHCKAGIDALDMATQAVRPLPHKKALRGRRMKGSRGFKSLPADELDKDYEPGSEAWTWKRFDDGKLHWCDRKEKGDPSHLRRWFKCSQCRFMRENRALVRKHFQASCQDAWEEEQRSCPQEPAAVSAPPSGRSEKAPRLSRARGAAVGVRGGGSSCQATPLPASPRQLPDTHIKALILIDTLLEDGTFSAKQAQQMRWLCMWRQPPISVLMLAYGTNPELFATRCTPRVLCRVLCCAVCRASSLSHAGSCPPHHPFTSPYPHSPARCLWWPPLVRRLSLLLAVSSVIYIVVYIIYVCIYICIHIYIYVYCMYVCIDR